MIKTKEIQHKLIKYYSKQKYPKLKIKYSEKPK